MVPGRHLVNPHDVMFVDTDPPESNLQNSKRPFIGNARPPEELIYRERWNEASLAPSRHQPYDEVGRPTAHGMYQSAHATLVGSYPFTDARLDVYQNYYFNCIRDCVVGKGATAYREQNHVPLVIRHPDYPEGMSCPALTSHVDVVPTLLGLTGVDDRKIAALGNGKLKGRNLAVFLNKPTQASIDSARDSALFNYSMLLYYDSEWLIKELDALRAKGMPEDELHRRAAALQPDFRLRGTIRSVFDGRYRYSRYFSPLRFNTPRTMEEIFAQNDVELYDRRPQI